MEEALKHADTPKNLVHPLKRPGEPTAPRPSRGGKLAALVLTQDRQQRLRIIRSLLSALVFVVCVGLIAYASVLGIMDPHEGRLLAAGILTSNVAFYVALRSGFNLRFEEPSLTLPQILAALTWIAGAYGTTNAAHGGTLMLVALVLVFGVFNMDSRRALISGLYAIWIMGIVMSLKAWTDPARYPAQIEWVYFVFVATIVPMITMLAAQLTHMRTRLKAQKAELTDALDRIREMAIRDELTGLINRRQMLQVLNDNAALNKRDLMNFSVALLDLDFFKRVNDTHGHGVGDEVLRGFAAEAQRVLRETDIIARWGGEEFLVVMPELPPGSPTLGLERLRATLASLQLSTTAPDLRMAFSAGVTAYRVGESTQETIERADKALYEAKAAGRNRCVLV
jgi:diguanylate cyclase (GGDEF)-like protein